MPDRRRNTGPTTESTKISKKDGADLLYLVGLRNSVPVFHFPRLKKRYYIKERRERRAVREGRRLFHCRLVTYVPVIIFTLLPDGQGIFHRYRRRRKHGELIRPSEFPHKSAFFHVRKCARIIYASEKRKIKRRPYRVRTAGQYGGRGGIRDTHRGTDTRFTRGPVEAVPHSDRTKKHYSQFIGSEAGSRVESTGADTESRIERGHARLLYGTHSGLPRYLGPVNSVGRSDKTF